ncbi:MAG TPA: haloacid dehalogenase-like hydrolase [Acidobacteriaceae bacterium]|nr:haloacid dehalogenase-like hydrolase [Acidobacteriaceae bacterium]
MPETTPALRLTTPDFHARVHSLNPTIAVFDCDGTLWSGDAGSAFMHWSIDTQLISPSQIAWLNQRYDGYKRGTVSEYDICGDMTQVYRGLPVETLRSAAAHFFADYIEPNIFPELAVLIAELRERGCDIWAVSSTNNWVIEEGVRRFNIPANHVLSARVEIADGLITDNLLHVPTDEDKVVALRRVGITAPDAVFGNSIHDAAMLSIARTQNGTKGAFPVNPSTGLLARAAAEAWPVYYPASVTP